MRYFINAVVTVFSLVFILSCFIGEAEAQSKSAQKVLWEIGKADNSAGEFALTPSGYNQFLEKDFGWEDGYFLIGKSEEKKDWPYALPGPQDRWSGSSNTAGWRTYVLNILFGVDNITAKSESELVVDLLDMSAEIPPLLKITINGKAWKYSLPKGSGDSTLQGQSSKSKGYTIKIPLPAGLLKKGGNEISLTTLWGNWLVFDQVRMESSKEVTLQKSEKVFVRNVQPADYTLENEGKINQHLLVDIEHVSGTPILEVFVAGNLSLREKIEQGRNILEAPMPAVNAEKNSSYEIKIDGRTVQSGSVKRSPQIVQTLADYVDTKMGTAHSRWMIAPGPWMPFSMVKLSPDNQNGGWQAGYDPIFESVGGFSHIHEWTMSGLSMLPVNGPLITDVGDQSEASKGYRSPIEKGEEEAPIGYYKTRLTKYNIKAELTATTRCSFQRYTFPKEEASRVLVDFKLPAEYGYELDSIQVTKIGDHRIEGFSRQRAPGVWGKEIDQDYTIYFVMEFDQAAKRSGYWNDKQIVKNLKKINFGYSKKAGLYLEFDTRKIATVQVRTGISYVSIDNAGENLHQEITHPFGWDFNAVRQFNKDSWNNLFNRIHVSTPDRREKVRFYTNMYRALCSRNTFSDANGQWRDATNAVQQLKNPGDLALGCDAFWNTFWNLNQFWNLVTPEWSSKWVKSQLAMYDANGWLAKGPAGMKYIPVMVAEHEIPLIVSTYQMGIRDYNVEKAYEAVRKMETTPAQKVGKGLAGNQDLEAFLEYKYVPYDKGRFSNTLEYAFDNWTVAQFAGALGKKADYALFGDRGNWWKNVLDSATGYARLRKSDGSWKADFNPFTSGANEHYVEGNAWQLTYFVPQDVPGLAKMMGIDTFVNRLQWGFEQSYKWRFNAPGDAYWEFPVVQGNQQSMHFAFLFNWVNHPWLTQRWSRAILQRYYGHGLSNAYLGDEDQGQMSAWFMMAAIGLFQTDGGCSINPVYEIASPLFKRVTIDLGERYGRGKKFTIIAPQSSPINQYVQKATLNGQTILSSIIPAAEVLKGGELILEMGPKPNKSWGLLEP